MNQEGTFDYSGYYMKIVENQPPLREYVKKSGCAPIKWVKQELEHTHYYELDEFITSIETILMPYEEAYARFGVELQRNGYGFKKITPNFYVEYDDVGLSFVCTIPFPG